MNRPAAALLLAFAAPVAHGATFVVTRTDDPAPAGCLATGCSLREAILAANASGGPDRIELPAGTFTLSFVPASSSEVTLVPTGHVHIVGTGASTTLIRSAGDGSMLRADDIALTLEKLSMQGRAGSLISNGGAIFASGSKLALLDTVLRDHQAQHSGGAIHLEYSTLDMRGSVVSGSMATSGGGIGASFSDITLSKGSTISGNIAGLSGGGLRLSHSDLIGDDTSSIRDNAAPSAGGVVVVASSITGVATGGGSGLLEISNNRATGGPFPAAGAGGGIRITPTSVVSHVALLGNEAESGGGLFAYGGILSDSLIAANHATAAGGGVLVHTDDRMRLERVSIEGNAADGYGGAVHVTNGSLTLANVDVHDNTAPARAAISIEEGSVTLQHATITGNLAGRAPDVLWLGADAAATYANSIVAGRCTGNSAGIVAQGRNLRTLSFFGNDCAGTTVSTQQLALTRGTFGGLFDVSGTTYPASVLIDHGASAHCLPTDVRGAARDLRCDTGAFEYGAAVK
jgi:CSLREA domain-containing protein